MKKLIRKYIFFYFIYNRGTEREIIGENRSALNYFYLALTLNPNSLKTYFAIARVSRKVKEYLNGIDFADKGSRRFPFNAGLYAVKADLYRKAGDYENALKEYNLAVKNDAGNWEYYALRAEIKVLKQDIKGAVSDCARAVELNKQSPELFAGRAFCNFCLKNYSSAAQDYGRALELNPGKKHYKYMLEASKKLIRSAL